MIRRIYIPLGLLIALGVGLSWLLVEPSKPPLTILPVGQPSFTVGGEAPRAVTTVSFAVAVTNNTRSKLLLTAGLGPISKLAEAYPFLSFGGNRYFELAPGAGVVRTVGYNVSDAPQLVLGGTYQRVLSPAEAKVREFLHSVGIPWLRTNGVWHVAQVGRLVQE